MGQGNAARPAADLQQGQRPGTISREAERSALTRNLKMNSINHLEGGALGDPVLAGNPVFDLLIAVANGGSIRRQNANRSCSNHLLGSGLRILTRMESNSNQGPLFFHPFLWSLFCI